MRLGYDFRLNVYKQGALTIQREVTFLYGGAEKYGG